MHTFCLPSRNPIYLILMDYFIIGSCFLRLHPIMHIPSYPSHDYKGKNRNVTPSITHHAITPTFTNRTITAILSHPSNHHTRKRPHNVTKSSSRELLDCKRVYNTFRKCFPPFIKVGTKWTFSSTSSRYQILG